jgi:hypothetical protein
MKKIGACGDNCSECLRYQATISNNQADLQRVKELWVALGLRKPNVDPQEMKCFGCCKENHCIYSELFDCVFGKKIDNCGQCTEYPCAITEAVFKQTEKRRQLYKKIGSVKERDSFIKAFLCKKANLDEIHDKIFN